MGKLIKLHEYRTVETSTDVDIYLIAKEIEELEYNIAYGEGCLECYQYSMSSSDIEYYKVLNINEKQRLEYLRQVLSNIQKVI